MPAIGCLMCRRSFRPKDRSQTLCSARCRKLYECRETGYDPRPCHCCGESFVPSTTRQRFCGPECSQKHRRRPARDPRACDGCSRTFQPTSPSHRYCSSRCGQAHQRRLRKSLPPEHECAWCGEPHPATTHNRRYCSQRCRFASNSHRNNERRRERYRAGLGEQVCPSCGKSFKPRRRSQRNCSYLCASRLYDGGRRSGGHGKKETRPTFHLAGWVAEFRRCHGLSRAQLAQRIGMSLRAVTAWESGRFCPKVANLWKIWALDRGRESPEDVRAVLSERVERLRLALELKPTTLARMAGLEQARVRAWEGSMLPRVENLLRLARETSTPLDWFFGGGDLEQARANGDTHLSLDYPFEIRGGRP